MTRILTAAATVLALAVSASSAQAATEGPTVQRPCPQFQAVSNTANWTVDIGNRWLASSSGHGTCKWAESIVDLVIERETANGELYREEGWYNNADVYTYIGKSLWEFVLVWNPPVPPANGTAYGNDWTVICHSGHSSVGFSTAYAGR
jgi:hypothetical protein